MDKTTDRDIGLDWHFCLWLTKVVGVGAIPTTAFCRKESRPLYEKYVRFAFCKPVDFIRAAGEKMQVLKQHIKK